MKDGKLADAVAVVTGASSGIGRAIAECLAKNGAKVGLLARRFDRLKEVEKYIQSKEGKALAVKCDVADRKQVFEAVDEVRRCFGPIDILVNNAGIVDFSMTYNLFVDSWLETVDVNVIGTLHCYAATLQDMINRKSGHIINISSVYGRTTTQRCAAYHGSKFFMQGHSAGMRQELASLGIKVTVILPGITNTEISQTGVRDKDVEDYLSKTAPFNDLANRTVLESDDIAEVVLFALIQPDRVGVNEIMVEPKNAVVIDK